MLFLMYGEQDLVLDSIESEMGILYEFRFNAIG
jgi:hypothetical protein